MRKLVIAHLFFILITISFFYVNPDGPNLVWKLFLALLAFDFACLSDFFKARPLLSWFSLFAWLLFYPQTFSLLLVMTDFTWTPDMLIQGEFLLIFGMVVSSLLLAISLGLASVQAVLERLGLKRLYGRYLFMVSLSVLSSLVIYLEHYVPFSIWGRLWQPQTLLSDLPPLLNQEAIVFIIMMTFCQLIVLLFSDKTI